MKIGVVIGTHNNERDILATIDSVIAQSETDWRCLIVDNASSDDTLLIVRAKIKGDIRFTLASKANEGPSGWRNFGFAHFQDQAEFIHFLDGDDVLAPTFLDTLSAYLRDHPAVGAVGCQFQFIDGEGKPKPGGYRSRYTRGLLGIPYSIPAHIGPTPFDSLFALTGQGPWFLYRASAFTKTPGFDLEIWSHEDSDMACQMALVSEVHYVPNPLYLYRKRNDGKSLSSRTGLDHRAFRAKWDYFVAADPAINAQIEAALDYYYGSHAPFFQLRKCVRSLGQFGRKPQPETLRIAADSMRRFLADYCLKRSRKRMRAERRRRLACRSSEAAKHSTACISR